MRIHHKAPPMLLVAMIALSGGCSDQKTLVPAKGVVLYKGAPLTYGCVMLQPENGPSARATIQSDGGFELETPGHGAGATPGLNRVRVTCYSSQDPNSGAAGGKGEMALGKSLIPERYVSYRQSGLSLQIPISGKEDIRIELDD